ANDGTDDDCAAFAIAVTEACANAIEHAYGLRDETIELRASLEDGVANVTIRDHGSWKESQGGNRGRGIPIMREFMDDVSVESTDEGTTVRLSRRLRTGRSGPRQPGSPSRARETSSWPAWRERWTPRTWTTGASGCSPPSPTGPER